MDLQVRICLLKENPHLIDKARDFVFISQKGHCWNACCKKAEFETLHLCSDLCGFYEKFGFVFHTMAYDVFGFNNRIYRLES